MAVQVSGRRGLLLAAALACSLAACGPVKSASDVVATAPAKIAAAREAYSDAKAFAELILPYLSPERQARIRAIEAKIDALLFAADVAKSVVEQRRAVKEARAAIAELGAATT